MNSHSRKNRLYFVFRELGRGVRTLFLLRYIAELDLRHEIQTATTKSERFNKFVQWISFGGDSVIAENVRDEQRKFIKYNHLAKILHESFSRVQVAFTPSVLRSAKAVAHDRDAFNANHVCSHSECVKHGLQQLKVCTLVV